MLDPDVCRCCRRVPNLTAYNKLCDSLRDEKDGIRFQTESLRATLMGDNLPVDAKPLLKYWEEQEYKKLADENNTTYHARDYVKTLDKKITAIAALLFHGMNLSFFVAYSTSPYAQEHNGIRADLRSLTGEKDTERLNNECHTRVTSFRQKLWDTYPLALRHCKQYHYDNDGSYISSGSYFNFYQESDTTGKNWLTINNYWIREISLHTPAGNHSSKLRAFKFVAPDGPLGPLEMHAYWQVDGNSRVRFYDDVPAGGHRTWAYTNSQRGKKTYTIRFKMVPVAVSGGNSEGRRPIKFIPYFEDSKQVTRQDRYNTFGTEWRIEKTSNPQ